MKLRICAVSLLLTMGVTMLAYTNNNNYGNPNTEEEITKITEEIVPPEIVPEEIKPPEIPPEVVPEKVKPPEMPIEFEEVTEEVIPEM